MYANASNGLKMIFIAQIFNIIGSIVPGIVGSVIQAIAMIITLLGLKQAAIDEEGYNKAFLFTIINLLVGFFNKGDGILASLMGIVSSILALCIVHAVCNATSSLLNAIGESSLSGRGNTIWMLYLVCTVISVVCAVLCIIPIINILAAVAAFITAIVAIVAAIMYMVFIYQSSKALS